MGTGMGFSMWIFWGIIIFVIALLFIAIPGRDTSKKIDETLPETPLAILKKRYAVGEINEEEFKRMKSELEN